jgi:DNA-directed RNA polymerase specialized sigma24 family protein
LLATAQAAAAAKDAIGMVEALHVSGYLAGLKRMLQAKWSRLPAADVDDSVAEAVEEAYAAVSNRRKVGSLGAWLWKAADNIANDRWVRDHAVMRQVDDASESAQDPELHPDERRELDALADHRRAEAVRLARQLLSAVGHGQVRDVMDMVIDAVEAGEPDLPPEVVADTLSISKDAARALMSRGLDRLKTAARAEGFELPEDIPSDFHPDDETEEESE